MFWFLLSFTETEKEIMQENPPPPKTPTGEEKGSPPPLPVIPLIPTTVPGKGMDIGIVIGVTESEFEIIKMFISRLLIFISQNFPNVQFGLIIYSDRPELIMTLQHIEYVNVKVIIEGMSYVPGGHRTDLAMLYASRKLFCPVGCEDRPEEENVMILFTSEKTDAGSIPYSLVSPIMKVYEKALFLVKVPTKPSWSYSFLLRSKPVHSYSQCYEFTPCITDQYTRIAAFIHWNFCTIIWW